MFQRILIANRGEIACRIALTAQRLGITTIAVYSDPDKYARHVAMADQAIHIGPAPARESYLRTEKILNAAASCGAQAIHPGYGFLSENAEFAQACADRGITFIGPSPQAIAAMGSKSAAKRIMEAANVPLVPGYHGDDQSPAVLRDAANSMGYPVLLKATAGGGGKGMRQVWSEAEFDDALAAARREASASFGDDTMLVEKYLTKPRHLEIQVFFDEHGNSVYLAERDCSVQRRHQKVIEEAPAPGINSNLRSAMGEAALQAGRAINYVGAGTVEFLLDEDGSFFFMEMNTRLQVEHPVTEMITGQDLVEWQLRVASGGPLPLQQDDILIDGHAFEARIYAEDTDQDFLPATGTLEFLRVPAQSEHVRVDTGVREGDEISVYYDPMIAKLIVWGETRELSLRRLTQALREYCIAGTVTNIEFLHRLASHPAFQQAELDTSFIDKHRQSLFAPSENAAVNPDHLAVFALILHRQQPLPTQQCSDPFSPWQENSAWRMNAPARWQLNLALAEREVTANVTQTQDGYSIDIAGTCVNLSGTLEGDTLHWLQDGHEQSATFAVTSKGMTLFLPEDNLHFNEQLPDTGEALDKNAGGLQAPMNGTIVTLLVEPGTRVEAGAALLVMEAMKMEHTISAPGAGTVEAFHFQPGELVDGGATLVAFSTEEDM